MSDSFQDLQDFHCPASVGWTRWWALGVRCIYDEKGVFPPYLEVKECRERDQGVSVCVLCWAPGDCCLNDEISPGVEYPPPLLRCTPFVWVLDLC